ncbi:unnamed protein product, partial [Prorocentrum cordatum]
MEGGGKRARRGPRVGGPPALEADTQNNADLEQELGQVVERDIILQQWGPSEFAQLNDNGHGAVILPEGDPVDDSLAKITASFSHKFKEEISEWGREDMPETWTTALTLIALHVEMNIPWDPRSDLSCARVLGALFTDKFRAHKGSVAQYKEGPMPTLLSRYTGSGRQSQCVKLYGAWFKRPRPAPNGTMNFEDCTLVASGNWAAGNRLEQMPRSPTNDCYTHIPASLTYTPAQADVERLRLFLCTPCAGQAAGRRVAMAVEALATHGEPAPPKIIVLQGGGGNSKSATTKLRANVFADSDKFMSASCLQKVRAGDRVFLEDSTLSPFLASSVARHIYMRHHLLPFLQNYSADDCRRFISLPGQGTQDRTISFVQQMVTALGNSWSTYAATQKHRILKPYVFQSLSPTLLPGVRGTSVKGKKTKLQNLDDSIHAFPHIFKKLPLAGGDQKLQIDVQKFSDAMSRVENCGEKLGSVQKYDLSEPAAVLREIVNLTQLRAYCAKGIDSRQKQLESYIQWHETKGAQEGDFSTIEVKYYRPWGPPGRMYAFGMAAQELTRQARAAAFQGHAVDVDFVAAFSRTGYREACRITHNSTTYGIWRKSILHVGAWRGFIKDYMEISVGEGRRVIMDSPRFHYLRNQFGDRRAPDATRFAYATFALEDEELAKLVEAIKGQDSSTEALVYMFDGAIMSTPAGPAKIQSGIDAYEGTSQGISAIVKPFASFD